MPKAKRHHFLPEFYQHGFANDGYIWLFDRATGAYRCDQPKNTAVIGHYYSVELEDGSKDPRIETFLADHVESDAKPVIQELERGEQISDDDRVALATFASFLHFRTPRFQRLLDETIDGAVKALTSFVVESPDDLAKDLQDCPGLTEDQRAISPQLMYEFLHSKQYDAKATNEFRLQMMLNQAMSIQDIFRKMNFFVLHAPKGTAFLTTDAPVVVLPPAGHGHRALGFLTPGAKTVVPLSSSSLLTLAERGTGVAHVLASKNTVRQLNIGVVASCERFVLGRDETHVRSLVSKTQVDRYPAGPLMHVG
jgi:hypothetical protein